MIDIISVVDGIAVTAVIGVIDVIVMRVCVYRLTTGQTASCMVMNKNSDNMFWTLGRLDTKSLTKSVQILRI